MALVVLVPLFFGGCLSHTTQELQITPPQSFSLNGEKTLEGAWWVEMDAELARCIDEALKENFDIKAANERISQARYALEVSKSARIPSLDAKISESDKNVVKGSGSDSKSYTAALDADYELDIWGRVYNLAKSSDFSYVLSKENYKQAKLNIAKEIATDWYKLAYELERQKVLSAQIDVAQKVLQIIEAKYFAGKATYADILRYKRELESLRAEEILSGIESDSLKRTILTLQGKNSTEEFSYTPSFTTLPKLPKSEIPSILIQERPDVKAAYYSLKSLDAKAASAFADRFPKLSINLSLDSTATVARDLFENWIFTALGSIALPIFNAGELESAQKKAESAAQEASYLYSQAFLEAFQDIEDAYAKEIAYRDYYASVGLQKDLAKESFERSFDRYAKGASTYLDTLTLLNTFQGLETKELSAKMQLYLYRVNLYDSLGFIDDNTTFGGDNV